MTLYLKVRAKRDVWSLNSQVSLTLYHIIKVIPGVSEKSHPACFLKTFLDTGTQTYPFNLTLPRFDKQAAFFWVGKKIKITFPSPFRGPKGISHQQQQTLKKQGQLVLFTTHGQGMCNVPTPEGTAIRRRAGATKMLPTSAMAQGATWDRRH